MFDMTKVAPAQLSRESGVFLMKRVVAWIIRPTSRPGIAVMEQGNPAGFVSTAWL